MQTKMQTKMQMQIQMKIQTENAMYVHSVGVISPGSWLSSTRGRFARRV